jgi:GH15 family glucan-1,4-alpha-glucosidase
VAWRDWILRAIAGTPEHIRVMYRVDGGRHLYEWDAEWLRGYGFASPVRIGNAAAFQRQIDVYGELIDVLHLTERAGLQPSAHGIAVEQAIVEAVERQWRRAGHGIWENRGEPRQYVYSQVMAWVAIDRVVKSKVVTTDQDLFRRMKALREEIRAEVCREGFDGGLGTFVQFYGGRTIDASLLLIPLVGFLPADDPRMLATIRHIERELVHDGLVYRSKQAEEKGHGAFLACSCWLADCRQLLGEHEAARDAFERLLSVRNDVGLLSEEYDLHTRRLTGNFPQTLSHLALVTTALGLSGPIMQRGGG